MNYKYDSTRSVIVSPDYHWIEIADDSPRDATVLLIDRNSGVQTKGKIPPKHQTHNFTHWAPLPTFKTKTELDDLCE